jgi:hypothetical protein
MAAMPEADYTPTWTFFADKDAGRLTAIRERASGAHPAPFRVSLDTGASDDTLRVWRIADEPDGDLVCLDITLEGGEDFPDRVYDLLNDRLGFNLGVTFEGTAYHVLPGAFIWKFQGELEPSRRGLR